MHGRALAVLISLAITSCGQGRPGYDARPADSVDGQGGTSEAGARGDGAIRILTDVAAPRESDGRAGGRATRDAALDGLAVAGDDGAGGAPAHDARPETAPDTRDAELEASASLPTCSAVRACVHEG